MTKFFLTDHIPTGKIAIALPRLICLKSKYKTLKGMKRDLEIKLKAAHRCKSMKGKNEVKVKAELIRLKELHKAMKEDWSVSLYPTYLLKKRDDNATCKGYDFNNQSRLA